MTVSHTEEFTSLGMALLPTYAALQSEQANNPAETAEAVEHLWWRIHTYIQLIRLRQNNRHSFRRDRTHFIVSFSSLEPLKQHTHLRQ